MDELEMITVRKMSVFVPISNETLFPPAPRKPEFIWPSFVCGYEHNDDYYTEGHACELLVGHEGPHQCSLEWETRPRDLCQWQGHVWGEWQSLDTTFEWSLATEWTVRPEARRRCQRCGDHDYKGGQRNTAFSDALIDAILPRKA